MNYFILKYAVINDTNAKIYEDTAYNCEKYKNIYNPNWLMIGGEPKEDHCKKYDYWSQEGCFE